MLLLYILGLLQLNVSYISGAGYNFRPCHWAGNLKDLWVLKMVPSETLVGLHTLESVSADALSKLKKIIMDKEKVFL